MKTITLTWVGACGAEIEMDLDLEPGVDCVVESMPCPACGGPMLRCEACEGLPGEHICSSMDE